MQFNNYVSLLETTAVISTVFQYLSGVIICRKYVQKKSCGDTSGFPFICGFLSCSIWLRYGILSSDNTLILVNTIGATLFLIYSFIYYVFTVNKTGHLKQFGLIVLLLISVILYTNSMEDRERMIQVMGMICCIVAVSYFAAPLTMLVHVIRVRNAESLPFPLIVTSFLVSIQWLIYGVVMSDTYIQIANFSGCVLSMLQLCLFVCYPPKSYAGQGYKLVDQTAAVF